MKYIFSFFIFLATQIHGQEIATQEIKNQAKLDTALRFLRKADAETLKGKSRALDINRITGYLENGTALRGNELVKYLTNPAYKADIYLDSLNEISAMLFSPASKEEIEARAEAMKRSMSADKTLKGQQAPAFSLKDIKGNSYNLSQLKGKVVVLNFWFINCKPCQQEIPDLNEMVNEYKGKEVIFLGIALDEKKDLEIFLKKSPFNYQIIPDGESVAESYHVVSYPAHFVIDKKGKVVYTSTGLSALTVPALKTAIEKSIN